MRRRLGVSSELPVEHVILFASLPLETMNLASNAACCCVAFEVEQCRMVRKRGNDFARFQAETNRLQL